MADTRIVSKNIVNRWVTDYNIWFALELFKNQQHDDFSATRNLLDTKEHLNRKSDIKLLENRRPRVHIVYALFLRPMEAVDDMPLKLRVLQFLSRINEGEKLDVWFDPDESKTPLESALNLLKTMRKEFQIPQENFDHASTLLTEMILGIFIKNKIFDKAEGALRLYSSTLENGKRAIFQSLICRKINKHEVIEQMNFPEFRKEMLNFCTRLCPFTVPFLHKAAVRLVKERNGEQHDEASGIDEQDEPGPSSIPQAIYLQYESRKYAYKIQKRRLEEAYNAMDEGSKKKTFSEVEQEVEVEVQERASPCLHHSADPVRGASQSSEQEALFQRDSSSPMEASPADQPPQTGTGLHAPPRSLSKTGYTIPRLLYEPDSQPSSQCMTAAEELNAERTEEPWQTPSLSDKQLNSLQCPVSDTEAVTPTRKLPRQINTVGLRASTSLAESSSDREEDSPSNENEELDTELHHQLNKSLIKNSAKSRASSDSEEQEHTNFSKTPVKRPLKPPSRSCSKGEPSSGEEAIQTDISLDSSPGVSSRPPVPQTSSTPHKDDRSQTDRKWKEKFKNATEQKETWPNEDSYFPSTSRRASIDSTMSSSGNRKRMWTESETEKLKEGVKKFGEGQWAKIKVYYGFKDRTNVNLKDRWRTIKKSNLV